MIREVSVVDPELARLVDAELVRQNKTLSLIASENITTRGIMELNGSVLTNKVVEGYPGRRYHSGCRHIDDIERLAINRAKDLFKAEHANVQPHSGVNANLAVYAAVLEPGDRILSMHIAHGGHLSHGAPASVMGSKLYNVRFYEVDRNTEQVDFDGVERIASEFRPKLIIAGYSSYPRAIRYERFRNIADQVDAYLMVDMAHIAGLVAAGCHPSPVPFADFVTATCYKTLRGPKGGFILTRKKYAEKIDYGIFPASQGSATTANIASKALMFKMAGTDAFKQYAKQVIANARTLAERLADCGFRIVAGGTDTHQVIVDLRPLRISGADAEETLSKVGVETNKNLIPFDTASSSVTSGLRLGTNSVTTRGMREEQIIEIADIIAKTLQEPHKEERIAEFHRRVQALCRCFPIYIDAWLTGMMG